MRIAVIGAGIIGLATAAELVRRGHDVHVVDPAPASGASHAAAGMLAAVTETVWGQDALHRLMRESAARYPAFVSQLQRTTGHDVGFRTTPTLSAGVDAADRETLAQLRELQRGLGMDVESLTGSEARERESALGPSVTGAMLIADDHQIDPRRVTGALLGHLGDRVRAERATGVVRDGSAVCGIRLATGERVDADVVVVAAGLGVRDLSGLPALPLRPVWGDVVRVRIPQTQRPLVTRTIRALVHGRPVYVVPRADGSAVIGASVREGGVEGVQLGGVATLLHDAARVVPGLAECEIIELTARPRPASPDAVPLLGRPEAGLVISTGYDRHGILLTALAAELGADLAEGRDIDSGMAAVLDPLRFDGAAAPAPSPAFAGISADVTKGLS